MAYLGHIDFRNKIVNGLRVGDVVRRSPDLAWATECSVCATRTVTKHTKLADGSASCLNALCGKAPQKVSAPRASVTPIPTGVRSQETLEQRRFQREHDTHEAAKKERHQVLTGRDASFELSDKARSYSMKIDEAHKFNQAEAEKFRRATPSYYPCEENYRAITEYLVRQKIGIADQETFARAYNRLRSLGLLKEKPPAQEIPVEAKSQAEPTQFEGVDPATGSPRTYSKREVDAMDSTMYRKVFKLYGDNIPRLFDNRR